MYEPPDPLVLDRDAAREYAQMELKDTLAFLTDVVNYGTHLVPRALGNGEDDVSRMVICAGLLKHIVGMFDAAVVLLENGHSTTALAQVRSAFEATLFLELILEQDTEFRARVYLVGEYRRRRSFIQRAFDPSKDPGSFNADYEQIGVSTDTLSDEAKATGTEHLEHLRQVLSEPSLADIDTRYQKVRGNRVHDPHWYELLGHKSVRQIAKSLKLGPQYDLWYTTGSQVVHAQSPTQQWSVLGDVAALKSMRHLEDAGHVKDGVVHMALRAYRLVIQRYLPHEFPTLREKYLADWRMHFHRRIVIRYEYAPQESSG